MHTVKRLAADFMGIGELKSPATIHDAWVMALLAESRILCYGSSEVTELCAILVPRGLRSHTEDPSLSKPSTHAEFHRLWSGAPPALPLPLRHAQSTLGCTEGCDVLPGAGRP